jgi:hypothetical protein
MKLAVTTNRYTQNSATIHGYHIATDFFRLRLLHEQEFATHTVSSAELVLLANIQALHQLITY